MPIKKSAFKALRQSKKRVLRNQRIKKNIKMLYKNCLKVIKAGDKTKALGLFQKIQKALDKAARKGVFKENTAARKKSRLMAKLNKL